MKKHYYLFYILGITSLVAESSYNLGDIEVNETHFVATNLDKYNDIEKKGIRSLADLDNIVPSFSLENYGSRNVAFTSYRGQTNFLSTSSPVALYLDDIPLTYGHTFLIHDFYDISQVTVMSGPQGFETGLGAQAGIIQLSLDDTLVTNPEVTLKTTVANYNEKSLSMHASLPLEDGVIHLNALKNSRDGYTLNLHTGNTIDDVKTQAVSIKARKQINDSLEMSLTAMYDNNDDGGTPYQDKPERPFEMNQTFEGSVKQIQKLVALKINYDSDIFNVTSITSLQDFKSREYLDLDRTPENLLEFGSDEALCQISQEIKVGYEDIDNSFIAGLFVSSQSTYTYNEIYDYKYLGVEGYRIYSTSQPEIQTAIFTTYKRKFGEHWEVSPALRYQIIKQSYNNHISQFFPIEVDDYGFVNMASLNLKEELTWHRLLPKLTLSYHLNSNSFMYAEYAKGFKSGGYNYDNYDISSARYKSEDSDNYTLGISYSNSDKWNIKADVYATRIKNQQIETIRADLSSYIDNAERGMIYGLETSGYYQVNDRWNIRGSLALTETEYEGYISQGKEYSNNKMLYIPVYALRLGTVYHFDDGYYMDVGLKSDGKRYFNKENSDFQDAYSLFDMAIGYNSKQLSWKLYGTNITDKLYFNHIVSVGMEKAYNYGEPRRIGLQLSYKFH